MQLKSKFKILSLILTVGLFVVDFMFKYFITFLLNFIFTDAFINMAFGGKEITIVQGYLFLTIVSVICSKRLMIFDFVSINDIFNSQSRG